MQNDNQVITPQTQEITTGFNPALLELASASLALPAKAVDVNLSVRNWDTSKIVEFERAVFLGCDFMPAVDEKTQTEKQLEVAFFMDTNKNIFYKAAYQFVKAVKRLSAGANFSAKFEGSEKISNGNKAEMFTVKMLILGDATA
jgi:hypothetical protein